MAGPNSDADSAKAMFRARFRSEPVRLIYSRSPGGEGRIISAPDAQMFVDKFDRIIDRETVWIRRSVIASFLLPIFFLTLAFHLHIPLIGFLTIPSLLSWVVTWSVLRRKRLRFEQQIWAVVERRPGVSPLPRSEKVRRGYATSMRGWLLVIAIMVPIIALKAPGDIFPEEWRAPHLLARTLFVLILSGIAGVALLAKLIRHLSKR